MVAREAKPDLVVLDLAMPGGGGTAVLDRLRRLQGTMQVPVVVYSALPKERAEELVPAEPDVLFVQKPGTAGDVLAAVRALLSGH
jgi:CheY-like chemotaxis protein